MSARKTMVGNINEDVLSFTVGKDPQLDAVLLEWDCIGTAAHVSMLQHVPLATPLFTATDRDGVVSELLDIMRQGRQGRFRITRRDQDVHLAVERALTRKLGTLGKRVHTGRSRNDQVAVDLRLYAKNELLGLLSDVADLATALLGFARRHRAWPMVGRTHLQPGMPSTVDLWASAYAEGLLDDTITLRSAYVVNDRCPLGSAASYGVPLPIDRELSCKLLGFAEPIHNVLHAGQARGKCESVILNALSQVMLTLSRLSEDLILYAMPEFGYFKLPAEMCTGSSIMPQKKNPDVLELIRAKVARVLGDSVAVSVILKGLPGGYNRDLQEAKEPFLESLRTTRACVRIMRTMIDALKADRKALEAGFRPDVFAADRALELVAEGASFRDAYDQVRETLDDLETRDSHAALGLRTHLGAGTGLDLGLLSGKTKDVRSFARLATKRYHNAIAKLMGVPYPELEA
jgi:argininosuccinate lyase